MMIVPTLCVGMPTRTLRVRSQIWRRCAPKLQRYPRHALGSLIPQSVPFVTQSVTGCIPTQSVGTIRYLPSPQRSSPDPRSLAAAGDDQAGPDHQQAEQAGRDDFDTVLFLDQHDR